MMVLNMMTTLILMIEKTTKMELSRKPLEIMRKKHTAIFIDDKREMIQKMPTSQRDQTFLNTTRDDLQLKQNLVHQFTEAPRETNKAFGEISESIVSVRNYIGNG